MREEKTELITVPNSYKIFELENYQSENGLFPAAINSKHRVMNENFWIRDNYYIYQAVSEPTKEKMLNGFRAIFDIHANKIIYHGNKKPTEDWMYIHPLYNIKLEEITNERFGWPWVQHDCVGNLLEIFSQTKNPEDKERAKVLIDYLYNIEIWDNPDYGFWERGPKEIRASSMAAVLRGVEEFKRNHKTNKAIQDKTRRIISNCYNSLDSVRYDGESALHKADLALLSLIWPGKLNEKVINNDVKKNIIQFVKPLVGGYGIKRYIGDDWNGITDRKKDFQPGKNEMEWAMGLPWLYLSTKDKKYLDQIREIKKEFGTIPEGFIDEMPNCTPCLLWAEVMSKLAEKENELIEYSKIKSIEQQATDYAEKIELKIKPLITYQSVDKK